MGHVARVRPAPSSRFAYPGQIAISRGVTENSKQGFGIVLSTTLGAVHILLADGKILDVPLAEVDQQFVLTDIEDPHVASGNFSMSSLVTAAKEGRIPSLAFGEIPCPAAAVRNAKIQVRGNFWFRFHRRRWSRVTLTWAEFCHKGSDWRMIRHPWPAPHWPIPELIAAAESEVLCAGERPHALIA